MSEISLACTPLCLDYESGGISFLLEIDSYRFLLVSELKDDGTAPQFQPPLHGIILSQVPRNDAALHQLQRLEHYGATEVYTSETIAAVAPIFSSDRFSSQNWRGLAWRSPTQVRADLTLELIPAGYSPGSAMVLFSYTPTKAGAAATPYTILYTGNCTLSHRRAVDGLPLSELRGLRPDLLILDGTAGTLRYRRRRQQELSFLEGVDRCLQSGRSLVLPVLPWGMAQELLLLLKTHTPLATQHLTILVEDSLDAGLSRYQQILPELPSALQNLAQQQSLFWESQRYPRVEPLFPESTEIPEQPTILLVRADQDWTRYFSRLRGWDLWFPRDTDGDVEALKPWMTAQLEAQMPTQPSVDLSLIHTALQSGRGKIQTYCFPQHCDGTATCQLIHNLRPQRIFFFGPQSDRLAALAALDELNSRYQIHLPVVGQRTEFMVGDRFFHQPPPDQTYEVNLEETAQGSGVIFPDELTQDPRWQRLADTGILQVRWQGDELVLRGISGRELLHQDSLSREQTVREDFPEPQPWSTPNCGNCYAYRAQRCCNADSPLNGFRVSPDGYCPQHQWS